MKLIAAIFTLMLTSLSVFVGPKAFAYGEYGIHICPPKGTPRHYICDSNSTKEVAFVLDLPNSYANQPLPIARHDLVFWRNKTDQPHWLVLSTGGDLTINMEPWGGSHLHLFSKERVGTIINYSCKYHPTERGSIVVTSD